MVALGAGLEVIEYIIAATAAGGAPTVYTTFSTVLQRRQVSGSASGQASGTATSARTTSTATASTLLDDPTFTQSGSARDTSAVSGASTSSSRSSTVSSSASSSSTVSSTPGETNGSKTNAGAIAGGVVAGVLVVALILFLIWFIRRKKLRRNKQESVHNALQNDNGSVPQRSATKKSFFKAELPGAEAKPYVKPELEASGGKVAGVVTDSTISESTAANSQQMKERAEGSEGHTSPQVRDGIHRAEEDRLLAELESQRYLAQLDHERRKVENESRIAQLEHERRMAELDLAARRVKSRNAGFSELEGNKSGHD